MTHTLIHPQTARHDDVGPLEIGGRDDVEQARLLGAPRFIFGEQARGTVARETWEDVVRLQRPLRR